MTRVFIHFDLPSALTEGQLARLAEVRGVYGFLGIRLDEDRRRLIVEYDATRLNPNEVRAELHRVGIPAQEVSH
ncbi:MAG: hypothetical protein HY236_05520 [Acidobacteria bacterium]|nr:hypothetical protein [Acidobacteriota bacterium]